LQKNYLKPKLSLNLNLKNINNKYEKTRAGARVINLTISSKTI